MEMNVMERLFGAACGRNVLLMGIVNLTEDSFYAPSRCLGADGSPDVDGILSRVEGMLADGADIIDLGACSTRPGSAPVGAEEEWRRLAPVLTVLWTRHPDLVISIDTYWALVVSRAHSLALSIFSVPGTGDHAGEERVRRQMIINDISAGEDDPEMLPLVGRLGLRYIAMHKRGTPETMRGLCDYGGDVTGAVLDYFEAFALRAARAGIRDWILDPGFGFAKTLEQNYELLRDLGRFAGFGRPVLVGVSRKSMVHALHGITPAESLPQTQVLHFAALSAISSPAPTPAAGAGDNAGEGAVPLILRVHDVAEAARTVRTFRQIRDLAKRH